MPTRQSKPRRAEPWLHATAVHSSESRLIHCGDGVDKSAEFDWTFRSLLFPRSRQIITGNYIPNISPQVINSLCLPGRRHVRSIGFLALRGHTYIHVAAGSKSHFPRPRWQFFTAGVFRREHLSWAIYPILSNEKRR